MKILILLTLVSIKTFAGDIVSGFAPGGACRLATPIELGASDPAQTPDDRRLVFNDARLDSIPQELVDSGLVKDRGLSINTPYQLRLFNIKYGGNSYHPEDFVRSGKAGALVSYNNGQGLGVGLGEVYIGEVHLSSSESAIGGERLLTTSESVAWTSGQRVKQVHILMSGSRLVGLAFERIDTQNGQVTGSEVICVRSVGKRIDL